MSRYVDAELVKAEFTGNFREEYPTSLIKAIIDDVPTADVVEVRHGKWVLVKPRRNGRNATYKCTVCNQLYSSYYNDVQEWTHCPCGARMCKEKEE